jgi:hypothetical protein
MQSMVIRRKMRFVCAGGRHTHAGLLRLSCASPGPRHDGHRGVERVVGVWLHVGSRLYLLGPRHLLEEVR